MGHAKIIFPEASIRMRSTSGRVLHQFPRQGQIQFRSNLCNYSHSLFQIGLPHRGRMSRVDTVGELLLME